MKFAQGITLPADDTNTRREIEAPSGISHLAGGLRPSGENIASVIYTWVFSGAVILAIVFMVLSGIVWITSSGDSGRLQVAKRMFFYSALGLILASAAFLIVSIVVKIGGGDPSELLKFN